MDTPTSRGRPAESFHLFAGVGSGSLSLSKLGRRACGARIRTACAVLLAWLATASAGLAQDWAKEMFDHTSKDLGVVARGAKVEHAFALENIYLEDVHVASIRSSCGCTLPKVEQPWLKTYEKTRIVTTVDTRKFMGRKESTLTVVFDQPFPAEVRLNLYCYIRGDVVFQPGSVQFGTVSQGVNTQQKVTVSYAGRSDWRVVRVESPNPHLETTVGEISRALDPETGTTKVTYDLLVKLKETAPAGYIRDHLTVVTDDNDPRNSRVPLTVEGAVVPSVSVKPSPLMLGPVVAGASVTKPLVVQAKRPFAVVAVTCSDSGFSFTLPVGSKNVHLIPVKFTAGETLGKASGIIRIETDLSEGRLLEVKADAQVTPRPAP